jgi:hypothetical protein
LFFFESCVLEELLSFRFSQVHPAFSGTVRLSRLGHSFEKPDADWTLGPARFLPLQCSIATLRRRRRVREYPDVEKVQRALFHYSLLCFFSDRGFGKMTREKEQNIVHI